METHPTRNMCLGAYVDLPLDEVIELLGRADLDELLAGVVQAAFGDRFGRVEMHAVTPERVTDHAALLPVTWHTTGRNGQVTDGAATVQLFVVQSGRVPVTELIITLTVNDDDAPSVAEHAHRALEELTDRMVSLVSA